MMGVHKLKIWPIFFHPILTGEKLVEVRRNDRNFRVGDLLVLREFDPDDETYTGREANATISHIAHPMEHPGFGLEDGFVAMSLRHVTPQRTETSSP